LKLINRAIGLTVFSLFFTGLIGPAKADTPPSVVVIDTGVNTALFPNIVAEACFLEYSNCPNGLKSMEGPGAANTGVTTQTALTHGNEMLSVISQVNPDVKLIPIRIVGITATGIPYIYSNNAVKTALDWVVANKSKYNIIAVNISVGKIFAGCAVPKGTAEDVAALKAANVAVIGSTGNDFNRTSIYSIACLPDVVSVGATDNPDPGVSGKAWDPKAKPYIARYSNGNANVSFYTNARWNVGLPNGKTKFTVGTSTAAAALTGYWALNFKGTWQDTYNYLVANSTTASNEWLRGRYIYIKPPTDK
jgi:hypothetical protein